MSARKVIILIVVAVPVLFVSCLFVYFFATALSTVSDAAAPPGSTATDEEIREYIIEAYPFMADDGHSSDTARR